MSLAYIVESAQDSALEEGGLGWLMNRSHDATPMLLKFASLQPQVYKKARYLVKQDGSWKARTWDEYRALTGKPPAGTSGVLE
eukprot:11657276-Prorocentrum_lima.AAC.1